MILKEGKHGICLNLQANNALKSVHGKYYKVGCVPCILYTVSGGSTDWSHGPGGIKYTISLELRDLGNHGFILPPNQIIPTGEEVWAFHLSAARSIISEYA